ncbi:TIGR00282 family metallophosphoesterase [Candidatus Margulisiibacteriota bacterium]
MKVLFVGDIIGKFGRKITKQILEDFRKNNPVDFVIANGENLAHGSGITKKTYDEMVFSGVDFFTSGNHVWEKKEFLKEIDYCDKLVRPANYPPGAPGNEYAIAEKDHFKVGIINLAGRVFMPALDCPFRTIEPIIKKIKKETSIIIVDFHAEASSEKNALGHFLDGQVSAVLGTHTHIQTADERVLPKGTGYITDVGMVGAQNSIIGVQIEPIIERYLTNLPKRYEPEDKGPGIFNGVVLTIDGKTGRCEMIDRIFKVL